MSACRKETATSGLLSHQSKVGLGDAIQEAADEWVTFDSDSFSEPSQTAVETSKPEDKEVEPDQSERLERQEPFLEHPESSQDCCYFAEAIVQLHCLADGHPKTGQGEDKSLHRNLTLVADCLAGSNAQKVRHKNSVLVCMNQRLYKLLPHHMDLGKISGNS